MPERSLIALNATDPAERPSSRGIGSTVMTVTASEWLVRFATELGVDAPSEETFDELLRVASVAAHASERTAAPVSCWLAALAGVQPADALAAAERLAASIESAGDGGGV